MRFFVLAEKQHTLKSGPLMIWRPRSTMTMLRLSLVSLSLVAGWLPPAPLPRRTALRSTAEAETAVASRTERLLATLPDARDQASGAGFAGSLAGLRGLDAMWAKLRGGGFGAPAEFVATRAGERLPARVAAAAAAPEFDVCVLGGTLGIFLASALAARGLKASARARVRERIARDGGGGLGRNHTVSHTVSPLFRTRRSPSSSAARSRAARRSGTSR